MNRGSPIRMGIEVESGRASMRPRFMNRGSSQGRGRSDIAIVASMRPRFMNRGSDDDQLLAALHERRLQ